MKFTKTATGEQKSFEPLPEGDYKLVFLGVTQKTAKSSGNKMAVLEFQVEKTTRKVSDAIVLLDSMDWKWEQVHTAFHGPLKKGEQFDIDTDALIGQRCEAHLKIETYTNDEGDLKKVNRIGYYKTKDGTTQGTTKTHAAPKQEDTMEVPKTPEGAQDTDDDEDSDVPF